MEQNILTLEDKIFIHNIMVEMFEKLYEEFSFTEKMDKALQQISRGIEDQHFMIDRILGLRK